MPVPDYRPLEVKEVQEMSDAPTLLFLFIFIVATCLYSLVDPFEKDD